MNPPDYKYCIDEQTWSFIRKTEQAYPDNTVQLSIEQQRRIYDDMCAVFKADYPASVSFHDKPIQTSCYSPARSGCLCRHYHSTDCSDSTAHSSPCGLEDPAAQLMYFHGGGFVVGSLESHDDVCAEITQAAGLPLVSVDYRLSPEHHHPAAFDDAMAAVKQSWQIYQKPIVMIGDSAGGNLAAAVSHALRSSSIPVIGQVLIYPGLGGDMNAGSYLTHAHAPMLSTSEVQFYSNIRGNKPDDTTDPTLSPLADTDFSKLPPTVIISAECDPLSDDGMHYQRAINAAGGRAHWINESGLVHGYLRARHSVNRARQSFERILFSIRSLAHNQWPY